MSTVEKDTALSDMEYAAKLVMTGKKDVAFEVRIAEEAKRIRDEILKRHGVLDIGVPAIRELRE
jgi:hypothetical protein